MFYANNRGAGSVVLNAVSLVVIIGAAYAVSYFLGMPVIMTFAGALAVIYAFVSLGKAGGIAFGLIITFLNLIPVLVTHSRAESMPYAFSMVIILLIVFLLSGFIDRIEEFENSLKAMSEALDIENVEFRENSQRLKNEIEATRQRARNYRTLNKVAQNLTSALERRVIVDIISAAVNEMIGKMGVNFPCLCTMTIPECSRPR